MAEYYPWEEGHPKGETAAHLIGRAIFGGYFLYNGINHFMHRDTLSGYARAKGVPAPTAAVQLSGAMVALGGLSLLMGYKPKIGVALITTFLAGVSPKMHAFWNEPNPQARQGEMINFMKNVALAGGALLAAGEHDWRVAVTHAA